MQTEQRNVNDEQNQLIYLTRELQQQQYLYQQLLSAFQSLQQQQQQQQLSYMPSPYCAPVYATNLQGMLSIDAFPT